jgi:hypothetical protein
MANELESSSQLFTPLRRSPLGLSSYDVEKALGLPTGAWKRRRLYALRARSATFRELGIQPGDYLIVEPGERIRPSQLVLVREQGRTTLARAGLGALERNLTLPRHQTAPLPFTSQALSGVARVVGTVVGLLRRQEGGNVRAVSLKKRPAADQKAADTDTVADLQARLGQWCAWVEAQSNRGVDAGTLARWRGLSLRLATLLKCMKTARSARFFDALSGEIGEVLGLMAGQAADTRLAAPAGVRSDAADNQLRH